jgi:hypothetical protein
MPVEAHNYQHWEEKKMTPKLERRSAQRFPIERALRLRSFNRKGIQQTGQGRTINMSSTGILFATDQQLIPGRRVEVTVSWPAQLNQTCGLQFVARGRVVRVEPGKAALEILQHEFRTARADRFRETSSR